MALLVWSDEKFSVGIDLIDHQHKKLVEMVNVLHEARLAGKAPDAIGSVLTDLIDYTQYHFHTEEELMQTYAYPGFNVHKREHDALAGHAASLLKDYQSGKRTVTLELALFLKEWLTTHIQGTDRNFGAFLQEKGLGQLAGDAYA